MRARWLRAVSSAVLLTALSSLNAQVPPSAPAVASAPPAPPAATTPTAGPAVPATAGANTTPAQMSRQAQDSLLIVTAKEGSGSGFVAKIGGVPMLITNAHVIAGATRLEMRLLSGATVQPGNGQLAVGADVAAFAAPANLPALEVSKEVNKDVAIGDEVVIYGNSLGQSVATEIKGKILGIGPDVIEVDAPFVPGNSGSPIIHLKSGKVIGIATYLITRKNDHPTDAGVAEVRRFGYRLDTIPRWDALNWPLFQREAALVLGIEAFTTDYLSFMRNVREKHA